MKRRGSALAFVIIVVFSITAIVLVAAKQSSASVVSFERNLQNAQFKSMTEGAVAEAIADAHKGSLVAGSRTTTYANGSVSVIVAPHPSIARAFLLTINRTAAGRNFSATRTIGDRRPNPIHYALWVKSDYESDSVLTTTINGSVFFKKKAVLMGIWSVSEDYLVRETSSLSLGTLIGGHYIQGVRDQFMPSFDANNFTMYTPIGNSMGNISFGAESGGYYAGYTKSSGGLTLTGGIISGRGTIYVDGDLNVNGNYNYANATSRVVFIVRGKVIFGLSAMQAVGSFFAHNDVEINSLSLNVTRGGIATNDSFKRTLAAVSISHDPDLLAKPECAKHRVPGF